MRRLIGIGPPDLTGHIWTVIGDDVVVGRSAASDLTIDNAHVSQAHTRLSRVGGRTIAVDLGSTNGTTINGESLRGSRPLRHSDIITFGSMQARYEETSSTGGDTTVDARKPPAGSYARFDVGQQSAAQLNNVGGNQYIQQVREERESFLRTIAATKTRARFLVTLGFGAVVAGIGVFLWGFVQTATEIGRLIQQAPGSPPPDHLPAIYGPDIFGIPSALLGITIAFAGMFVLIIGIVLHVVAASRRHKFDARTP